MKNLGVIFLLFFITIGSISQAQEINVLGLYYKPMDLSASTTSRLDNNNVSCALIKVIITEPGVAFEGNIIGDIEFKTNEYWVYLSSGTKFLKIKIPGNVPLMINFKDYDILQAESKKTYELLLAKSTKEKYTTQLQTLTIKLKQPESQLKIDGYDLPVNNGIATALLPVGTHTYSAIYKDKTRKGQFTLFASSPQTISIDLLSSQETKTKTNNTNELSEEESIYFSALNLLKEGKDLEAENLAMRGIAKNYYICNEILEALLLIGFYDDNFERYKTIEQQIKIWKQSNKKDTPSNRSKIVAPKFA